MSNNNPPNLWKKGTTPYKDYLNSLTPEEYEDHLHQRRVRKLVKKQDKRKAELIKKREELLTSVPDAMNIVMDKYKVELATSLFTSMIGILTQAQKNNDVNAFTAVWDRLYGKPQTKVDVTSMNQQVVAPAVDKTLERLSPADFIDIYSSLRPKEYDETDPPTITDDDTDSSN